MYIYTYIIIYRYTVSNVYFYLNLYLYIYTTAYIYICVLICMCIYIYIQNHVLSRGHVVVVMVEKCISRYGLRALLGTIEFPPVDWDLVHFNTTRWKQALYLGKGRFHNTIHMMEWIKLHQVNLNIEIQCQVPFSCWCAWVQRIHHGKHQSHIRHTSYVHLPERVFSSPYNIINIYIITNLNIINVAGIVWIQRDLGDQPWVPIPTSCC